jgi:hypothetical protein
MGKVLLEVAGTALFGFSVEPGDPPITACWTMSVRRPDGSWRGLAWNQMQGGFPCPLAAGTYRLQVLGVNARGLCREFEIRAGETTAVDVRVEHAPMRNLRVSGPGERVAARVLRVRTYDASGVLVDEQNVGRAADAANFRAWTFAVPGTYEVVVTPDRGEETRAIVTFEEGTARSAAEPVEIRLR